MGKIRRALVSVSDKTGVLELAKGLAALKVEILSTGGTAKLLKDNGVPVIEVGDYTGQPEIMDGRLKTLHPKIHGGLLAIRSNAQHMRQIKESGIEPIDLVVVNLYPFEQTIAKSGVSLEEAIENIDIGGPTMLRAAAKNWQDVSVVVDSQDYSVILAELKEKGEVSRETNFRLAQKVFTTTARYDGTITNYLTGGKDGVWPEAFNYQGTKVQELRYGENPHQKAAYYKDAAGAVGPCVANARQLHGKELSYNNILDLNAALELVKEFRGAASVIIKHSNPSGCATGAANGPSLRDVFVASRECDPLSAFGGIIALNRPVDVETASEIGKDFYECVIAPSFSKEAFEALAAKKNIRLMEVAGWTPGFESSTGKRVEFKKVVGGLLVQDADLIKENVKEGKIVTSRTPSEDEWKALEFAWKVCAHVKSNAIVFAAVRDGLARTIGVGCGQMSRIDSTKIAAMKAVGAGSSRPGARTAPLQGAVMASDAFFPFRDNIDEASKHGIAAVIQPGGSLKDQESIDAANQHGMAMVTTGTRHFRH